MTDRQIRYQARRAAAASYFRALQNPHGPGRAADREDSAQLNAALAYTAYLRRHGLPNDDAVSRCRWNCRMTDINDWVLNRNDD